MEVTKPNPTISNCCWVSLRFTQPTAVGFHPTYMARWAIALSLITDRGHL
ncbi:hypothetical protein NIES39_Q00010 [Arthrospira platensis NIES-39]|nr:hypothetical protein NIES39_Q00010 [Arthrospira platensis NIES-39]